MTRYTFSFILLLVLLACNSVTTPKYRTAKQKYTAAELYAQPTYNDDGTINAVIEIPAGTSTKIEYDTETASFRPDQLDDHDRVIDFLPYVANYGFVPGTYMDPARGGDGDALDILVLGESQPTGTLLRVRPIALLNLTDAGEIDTKLVAMPADSSLQTMRIDSFKDLLINYDGAKRIIETWFVSYKGLGKVTLNGWQDGQAAEQEVRKWKVEKAE